MDLNSLATARDVMKENTDTQGKTTVLNLASDLFLGSGWTCSLLKTGVNACFNDSCNDIIYFIHPVRDFERVVLPMAKPWPRFSPWDLFSWGCYPQR